MDSSVLVLKALKHIDDVRQTAMQIAVNRADFLMMAYYLVELRPLLEELNRQQNFLSANSGWPALQCFTNEVESMHTFIRVCASRSRIYLLYHSHDLVQEMSKSFKQLAECVSAVLSESAEVLLTCEKATHEIPEKLKSLSFSSDHGHNKLVHEIKSGLTDEKTSGSVDEDEREMQATILLQKIANQLNVPASEVTTLKMELQEDLKVAESAGREDDVCELKQLCELFCSAEDLDDGRGSSFSEASSPRSVHTWEIPKSFYCPITKEVMREPVMLEQGHTYEQAAILEWFQRGYRTCPDCGKELTSVEMIPNVKLQQAMDEYFSKMHKQQLIAALRELRGENTPAGVEATINTIKSILSKNSGYMRLLVPLDGLGPLVSVLKLTSSPVREWILRTLYKLALLGDSYKLSIVEADAIPMFLRILQKSPGDKGGPLQLLWELSKCEGASKAILAENGSILIIASACNLCQNDQKLLAEKLLQNLCRYDESVIVEAAKSSIFSPLISSLKSGNEELKLKLAVAVSDSLELNEHSSSTLVKAGVFPPLLHLMQYGTFESKQAAGKALRRLSATDANKAVLANESAVPILVRLLDTSIPQIKVDALAILSNLATDRQVASEIDQGGTVTHHLGLLLGDPLMQEYSIKTLQCMAKDSQTVRQSLANMVPSIYKLLQDEGLSKSCQGSILGLLRFLAEDWETRGALQTSSDMIKFLIGLVEKTTTADEKEALLSLLAGLSKMDEMKFKIVSEGQFLVTSLGYLKSQNNLKIQEAAAVIFSELCNPSWMEPDMLQLLARQGLISTLVEILSSSASTERAKHYAIMTLCHFSSCTPNLTEHQSFLKKLLMWLGVKKFRICEVHSGKCTVKGTFCIVEARAVPLLINMIKEGGSQSAEQSVDALDTLLVKENRIRGADFLVKNGIITSLISIVGKSSVSTEKAAKMMELIFRTKKYRDDRYSKAASTSLGTILVTGTAEARRAASLALMHLKKVPRGTSYAFDTTTA